MTYKLIGQNFLPPDVDAKVRGKARYTEDMRVDGMLHCKLLTSPMPHARVRRIDAAAALAMPGVVGILTADDVPSFAPPQAPILSNEPLYIGAPILAVAAVDESTAVAAVEAIKLDLEPLPFVLDPLDALRPNGPSARREGNVGNLAVPVQTVKWKESDFAGLAQGRLPMGTPVKSWSYGDLDAGFRDAKFIVEESFVTSGVTHHCLETRSALAYWQNGKCILYGSTQGHTFEMPDLARFIGIEVDDLVYVSEFCGGGFGSKAVAYTLMAIPAHMARKTGRPVMMRISRDEEYAAAARSGLQCYVKIGFRADGRITALDLYVVQDEGPFDAYIDFIHCGEAVSAVYQPLAMRWGGIPVFTNSPPRTPFRGPGTNSMAAMVDPYLDRAAKALGLDRVAIRRLNAPDTNGGKVNGDRQPMSSAYLKEALDQAAALFKWEERSKRNGQRKGSKITALGVGQAYHVCGYNGFDGLVRITPDGKLHVHTGVGNLGTYSYASTCRTAAEVLNCRWENTVIEHGDSRRGLPWNLTQDSSNTSFTSARTNYAAAMDAKRKLCEIAAITLGGSAADYDLGQERVIHQRDASRGLSFAQAAQRAIELGGRYSGHEVPVDIHVVTKTAVGTVAGTGLVGVARDNPPLPKLVPTFACTFVEIELDAETGAVEIVDLVTVSDCGVVVHPKGLEVQLKSGSVQGIGLAHLEHHVFDAHLGIPIHASILDCKPPSFLDVPVNMLTGAINKPDPQHPMGTKGMGEPPMGAACGALVSAIQEALGGVSFNRLPVTIDMVINALAKRPPAHTPLQVNCV
jgi:xanthine dehydrogenase molybdenum-binding subunit